MKKQEHASPSPAVSKLGFGCMRLPLAAGSKDIDAAAATAMLDYAYEHGVNYFDTAWGYLSGQSEPFVGAALKKYPRDSFHLASKMPGWLLKDLAGARKLFADQLERCQVGYFDYYLLHSLSSREEFERLYVKEKVLDYLYGEKQSGRIRQFGFSFHGPLSLMQQLLDEFSWDFVQIQLNYLDWDLQNAKVLYEMARAKGLPCIIMEPVRGGALATLNDKAAAILRQAAPQRSLASWAIRYAASLPGVLTVLSGMSTQEQLLDNLATMADFQPITESEKALLQQALEAYLQAAPIPCTACAYCLPCPFGVDIPGNFGLYNKAVGKRLLSDLDVADAETAAQKRAELLKLWEALAPAALAEQCRSCGKCVPKCPQHIAIPQRLKEVADLLADAGKERPAAP
ncbi:MAG: aldo/keto reductase [Lentisphaeria bacterium]|nr:aldo/keto reductase [Lentisphaeria bacterium]